MIFNHFFKQYVASLAFIVFLGINPAYAMKEKCYKIPQFEAEQGLRIHSELLVISLTCQKTPGYADLYSKYQRFTDKNKLLLSDYENRLINFFKSSGSINPSKQLHTLRTNLANEISQHAINMSVTSFCNYFGKRVDKALNMNKKTLQRWARQIWEEQNTSHKLCPKDKLILQNEAKDRKARRKLLIEQQRKRHL